MGCQAHKAVAATPPERKVVGAAAAAAPEAGNATLLTVKPDSARSQWRERKGEFAADLDKGLEECDVVLRGDWEEGFTQEEDSTQMSQVSNPDLVYSAEVSPNRQMGRLESDLTFATDSSTSLGIQSCISVSPTLTPATTCSTLSLPTRRKVVLCNVQGPIYHISEDSIGEAAATPRQPMTTPRLQPPPRLWLIAPLRAALQGEYRSMPGWVANGEFIWRQTNGDGLLFNSVAGQWMVTDNYRNMEMNKAQIRTRDPHYSKLPQDCSRWMYGDASGHWTIDVEKHVIITPDRDHAERLLREQGELEARQAEYTERRAADSPDVLWIAAPPKPALQGEYRKVKGSLENHMPVWRQVDGKGWLFNCPNADLWVICSNEPRTGKNKVQIRTSASHRGKWPHEISSWKHSNATGGFASDLVGSIRVSTDEGMAAHVLANYDSNYGSSIQIHTAEC